MAITSVALTSAAQTHYGTPPNDVAAFLGTFAYDQISATAGKITIDIQNTTDPSFSGYLVAMAWNTPTAGSPTISTLKILYNNTSLDLIKTAPQAFDCLDAVTGYGNATMGLAINSAGMGTPSVTWNCAGVVPGGPGDALRSWQKGTIVIALTGSSMGSIQASSFSAIASSGANGNWFPVHFRWLRGNDFHTNTTVGDDFVGSA